MKPVSEIPRSTCSGSLEATVFVKNNGEDNLKNLDIYYSINGGTPVKKAWTGDLGFLNKEGVKLTIDYDPTIESNVDMENYASFTPKLLKHPKFMGFILKLAVRHPTILKQISGLF